MLKNKFLMAVLAIAFSNQLSAFAEPTHVTVKGEQGQNPVTPEAMNQVIIKAAETYKRYAPVPRAAFKDITFPIDASELRALDHNLILYIAALSQDRAELPLRRAYVIVGGAEVGLTPLASVVSHQADGAIVDTFGRFRQDSLFLLPLVSRLEASDLFVDFQGESKSFKIGLAADVDLPPDIGAIAGEEPTGKGPTELGLKTILQREYPGFVSLTLQTMAAEGAPAAVPSNTVVQKPVVAAKKIDPWTSQPVRVGITVHEFLEVMKARGLVKNLSQIPAKPPSMSFELRNDTIGGCPCKTQYNFEFSAPKSIVLCGIENSMVNNNDLAKVVDYLTKTYGKPSYPKSLPGCPVWEHPLTGGYGIMVVAEKETSEAGARVSFIRGKD